MSKDTFGFSSKDCERIQDAVQQVEHGLRGGTKRGGFTPSVPGSGGLRLARLDYNTTIDARVGTAASCGTMTLLKWDSENECWADDKDIDVYNWTELEISVDATGEYYRVGKSEGSWWVEGGDCVQ
jgi:hypothetical protein